MAHLIRILPEHIANQIAAGEVVQRPESVVKELVENALDAGASSVTVVVQGAGKALIHVIDDGTGMSREDLELCLVRHATSKIRTEEDLHHIATLGFRGEAMASIAAVADVEIRTRARDADLGWTLTAQPGKPLSIAAAANEPGTQVLVRQLFSSVPGRRKFLKSDLTEFRHISETMQTMALSRPGVRFVFYDGPNRIFDVAPSDLRTRIGRILSINPDTSLVEVSAEQTGVTISGFVGRQDAVRQNRSGQFLFLNGRPIKSRALSHAVNQAFEHLVRDRDFPIYVLDISIDPERVDVNVHPQKHEVKFDDERSIYVLLQDAVMHGLARANIIPPVFSNVSIASHPLQSLPTGGSEQGASFNRLTGEILPVRGGGISPHERYPASPRFTSAQREGYNALFAPITPEQDSTSILAATEERIICLVSSGIMVVRPRAAAERVYFEQIMSTTDRAVVPQPLLFPVDIPVDAQHQALLVEHREVIAASGLTIEVDNGILTVLAVPPMVSAGEEQTFINELLSSMIDLEETPMLQRHEALAARLARQYARRSCSGMNLETAGQLVQQLRSCKISHHTPFGHPTFIVVSFDELEKRFA